MRFNPPSILRMQPAQPIPSTARSRCDRPASRLTNIERSRSSGMAFSTQEDAVLGAKHASSVAREFDHESPLTDQGAAVSAELSRRTFIEHHEVVGALV